VVRCNWVDEPSRRFTCGLWAMLLIAIFAGGCRLGAGRVVPCPLASADQKAALLKIAPLGTPRDAAIQKFEKAGIEGSFGISETVFYCDFWKRANGERWDMDLSMLFDQSGQLYKIRANSFLVGISPADDATGLGGIEKIENSGGWSQFEPNTAPANAEQSTANWASAVGNSSGTRDQSPVRSGRRTPFANESGIR